MIKPPAFDPVHRDVGIFSPASTAIAEFNDRYERAKRSLAALGWRSQLASGAASAVRLSAAERAADIHELLRDDDIGMLMAASGGYGSNELLDHLDFALLRARPKPIVGFSDVTALLLGIACEADLVTFHGPSLLPSFGEFPQVAPETVASLVAAVSPHPAARAIEVPASFSDEFQFWGRDDKVPLRRRTHEGWTTLCTGEAEGRLIGGNLDTLVAHLASRFIPPLDGAILFVEAAFCSLSKLARDLTALAQAGVLERCVGLIVGRPFRLYEGTVAEAMALCGHHAARHRLPAVGLVDMGHTVPIISLPIGIRAHLIVDGEGGQITLLEEAVV